MNCTTLWQEATKKFSEHGMSLVIESESLGDEAIALLFYFFGVLKTQIGKPYSIELTIAG